MRTLLGAAFAALGLLTSTAARASLIAYDGFDYQPGTALAGQSGGFGFDSPWRVGGVGVVSGQNYTISSGSLAEGGLGTSGNSVSVAASATGITGLTRSLVNPVGGFVGDNIYLSFLIRPDGPLNGGLYNNFFGVYLNSLFNTDQFVGKPGNGQTTTYDVEDRGGANQAFTNVQAATGQTALLVLHINYLAPGIALETLYVDPQVGGPEPTFGAFKTSNVGPISGVTLYSTGAYSLDEVRIGTTYADVTSVPEPASLVSVGLGLAGVGVAARRRSRA